MIGLVGSSSFSWLCLPVDILRDLWVAHVDHVVESPL